MRHRKSRLQLNRFTSWRKATLISLAKNLLIRQSIKTTLHKAKATIPLIERLITLAKENSLTAKREAFRIIQDHKLVSLLFKDIGARFNNRVGGYVRIINLGFRRGDNAQLAILELTEIKKEPRKKVKKEKQEKVVTTPEKPSEEKKLPKPPVTEKPTKKFLGGLRKIFKKKSDSL